MGTAKNIYLHMSGIGFGFAWGFSLYTFFSLVVFFLFFFLFFFPLRMLFFSGELDVK